MHEFTENVLRNHFVQVKAPIRMDDLRKMDVEQTFKTMGGETVSFRSYRKIYRTAKLGEYINHHYP